MAHFDQLLQSFWVLDLRGQAVSLKTCLSHESQREGGKRAREGGRKGAHMSGGTTCLTLLV